MKIFILICLFVQITFVCCEKKDPGPAPHHAVFTKEELSYLTIPLNRTFIYQDSISGDLDSVVLTKCDVADKFYPATVSRNLLSGGTSAHYNEKFTFTLEKLNGAKQDWLKGQAIAVSINTSGTLYDSSVVLQFCGGDNILGDSYSCGYGFYYPSTILPTFKVGHNMYSNVLVASAVASYLQIHSSHGILILLTIGQRALGLLKGR